MPAYLQEITREQARALDSVVNASDSQAYYAGIAQYTDTLIATYDNGNLVGTDRQSLVAEKNLYSALSKLDDPQLYHDSSEMPALPYTCYVFAQISPIIWLILPLSCAALFKPSPNDPTYWAAPPSQPRGNYSRSSSPLPSASCSPYGCASSSFSICGEQGRIRINPVSCGLCSELSDHSNDSGNNPALSVVPLFLCLHFYLLGYPIAFASLAKRCLFSGSYSVPLPAAHCGFVL